MQHPPVAAGMPIFDAANEFEAVRQGDLEVRLARSEAEVRAAQRLRYRIFYDEMSARPTAEMLSAGRDFDDFDLVCDHLLVIDLKSGEVVGTYRLIRRSAAMRHGRFYSADEYDIAPLLSHPGEILELGRSCVAEGYSTRLAMQLLWRGIAAYVFRHEIGLMFGCASLPGTDVGAVKLPLSYLHHHHLAPPELRPRAVAERHVEMALMTKDEIDVHRALAEMPPLIKGYLRLGGFVGDGAVIDHQFNTTDVCIIVKTDLVTAKYYRHYERSARDSAEA
ncbi:MAG: GNAT family N-acetyltransferase [Alphaproteobacteria bacterium]|nr:GNAT family N-acetyltransferase [Alphaproteobacteria bacterium]